MKEYMVSRATGVRVRYTVCDTPGTWARVYMVESMISTTIGLR